MDGCVCGERKTKKSVVVYNELVVRSRLLLTRTASGRQIISSLIPCEHMNEHQSLSLLCNFRIQFQSHNLGTTLPLLFFSQIPSGSLDAYNFNLQYVLPHSLLPVSYSSSWA